MSVFYAISAVCKIGSDKHESEPIQEVLKNLMVYGDDKTCDYRDGMLALAVSGFMASSGVMEIDELLKQLGGHLSEAAEVDYEYEGEKGQFLIGPSPAAIQKLARGQQLSIIGDALVALLDLDVPEHMLGTIQYELGKLRVNIKKLSQ